LRMSMATFLPSMIKAVSTGSLVENQGLKHHTASDCRVG